MSEDQDVDIESDFDEDDEDGFGETDSVNTQYMTPDEKRAHHNALERKRRDHIKESFLNLRDAVPSLQGEKCGKGSSISRSQILKQATEYIQNMTRKNGSIQHEINELKKQNRQLEQQVTLYERAHGNSKAAAHSSAQLTPESSSDASDDTVGRRSPRTALSGRAKRMKTGR
jgi:Max protein